MQDNKACCDRRAIQGIHCDAYHCVYNKEGCSCHAPEISVGPTTACTSSETVCATFKPKEEA